ncbi:MAG: thiamine pyrophosphate-binding protein, partial [Gammaproteobacteria bacterium]
MTTTGEKLAQMLDAYGIEIISGIPGTHTIELYRGLPQTQIRHITPRHEQGAGFLADGYARVTGKPAACITVSGPGALNIATAMGQALADSVPMLVISADNKTYHKGLGEGRLHETPDLQVAMSQCSRWSHTLARPDELPGVLARAFAIFSSERPGPVHLTIPLDVITAEADHLSVEPWALPNPPAPDPVQLRQASGMLNQCQRPVLALGGGAADTDTLAVSLAETLDAPVTLTHNAKGLIAAQHPLFIGGSPTQASIQSLYSEADVVLAIGTELG